VSALLTGETLLNRQEAQTLKILGMVASPFERERVRVRVMQR